MDNFKEALNDKVVRIKFNADEKNSFIQDYKPFIAASVEKCIGRYVVYGYDDELSIGLIAFEEAIRQYEPSKGSFLAFANTVIKRRLIDYYRKEKRHQNIVYINDSINDSEDNDEVYDYIITGEQAQAKYQEQEINELRRLELVQLKEELKKYDLSFNDIAKSSPKHKGTKKLYLDIVKYIIENNTIVKTIKAKMYLPIAEIEAGTKIPRKTIERSRNYVIAAVIILTGDYYCIREFIDWGWQK
ncbi:MAG: RNA polymerase sigma-I factor [Bacillota bacterium]